ncbi:MAG: hypothetical protein AABY02_02920 [Nanoarchaeota archaeon]
MHKEAHHFRHNIAHHAIKKDRTIVALVLFLVVSGALALYFTFKPASCESLECFQDHMVVCKQASFVNENREASWRYTIQRLTDKGCAIEVTLLQAKEGELHLRAFEGDSMLCTYPRGVLAYPDKDMFLCHGLLKEDLQGLIIEKLHGYIIKNLDDIKDEFNRIEANKEIA